MRPASIQLQMPGYPGQIHANIGPIKTNVTFDHRDCGVTLLKNDHVLINLLYDLVTGKRRAANIRPKIPFTFTYTKETRELVKLRLSLLTAVPTPAKDAPLLMCSGFFSSFRAPSPSWEVKKASSTPRRTASSRSTPVRTSATLSSVPQMSRRRWSLQWQR